MDKLPKGCFYCKHYPFDKKGIIEKKCLIGENEKFEKWWENNKDKLMNIVDDDELICFEESQ